MCLVLTGATQGVPPHYTTWNGINFDFSGFASDAFPTPGRLYIAQAPTTYSLVQVEILSMSLSGRTADQPCRPTVMVAGETCEVDSFFDVFTELTLGGGGAGLADTIVARLSGPVQLRVTADDRSDATGTFDTEIIAMSLSGDVGGIHIQIGVNPTMPSAGATTITEVGDGRYQIDSFFDVFTELSIDGGPPTPADGPTRLELTPVRLGQFEVAVAGNNRSWNDILVDPVSGGNDGWSQDEGGPRWFPYPQEEPEEDPQGNVEQGPYGQTFWNEWWYNDPYDAERLKMVNLYFKYKLTDPTMPGFIIVAINWSTTDWSLNPPPGTDPSQQPPLSDFDPATPAVPWVGRMQVKAEEIPPDSTSQLLTFESGDFRLPVPYNPEWVSIDVRGYNFTIEGGQFSHECVEDPDVPPAIPASFFEQLDWVGPFDPTPDSSWGRVRVEYNEPAGIYYYNLAIDTDETGLQWVVMNRSIETPGGPQTLSTYLDLGNDPGTDVPALSYTSSLSPAPLPLASGGPAGTVQSALVANLSFQVGTDGALSPPGAPGAPAPDPKPAGDKAISESGVLADLDKFVNQPQDPNQCAPGAVSNSLKYLQATGKVSNTLPTDISDVGAVLGSDASGTDADWPTKKKEYYKKHVTTRFIEAPLDASEIRDLIKQLKDGQDIEMDLVGHVEVLAGLRWKKDGTVDFDLFDDNQTDDESDPMHTSPLMTDGTNDKVDGKILERFVVECPVKKTTTCVPSFSLNTYMDWTIGLEGHECGHVTPVLPHEWDMYMSLWQNRELTENDEEYPQNEFKPAEFWVFEGDNDPHDPEGLPNDAGLVMGWGNADFATDLPPGNYASALRYKYGADPDLSNSIITVVVTAPQFGMSGQITQVSLGLEMPPVGSGIMRSWYWNCGNAITDPIKWGVPTTIKIDTSLTGTTAATPTATNYFNTTVPVAFDITNVLSIIVDENANWVGGPVPSPPPGGPPVFMWNYWHWLMVSPKTTLTKGYFTKWSQGPVVIDTGDPPLFWGWDEPSDYYQGPVVADDWLCKDKRPITDFHWWGSFPGWKEPHPPCQPKAFHLGIWTDTPAIAGELDSFSHPDKLVWSHICDNYVWNFAGYDRDPRQFDPHSDPGGGIPGDDNTTEPSDSCFQYNQLLSQEDWFYQDTEEGEERIYWLSIAPIWDSTSTCDYQWGWKTRPNFFMDDAVSIQEVVTTSADGTTTTTWPPTLGSQWAMGVPLQIPAYSDPDQSGDAVSWDVAFELTTIEPSYKDNPIPGDLDDDGDVDIVDLSIMAANYNRRVVVFP